jgi:hypothetical protein
MGQVTASVARTDSIRLKLSPDMVARLEKLSVAHGMPISTVAAFGLSDWICTQERNASLARMAAMEIARQSAGMMEGMGEHLEKALPAIIAAMQQAGLEAEVGDGASH